MTDEELAIFIGNKIKEYRKLKGLTQKELAKTVGMGDTTIANYEKGLRTPKKNTMFALAKAFNIPIDDLFPPIKKSKQSKLTNDPRQELLLSNYNLLNDNYKDELIEVSETLLAKQSKNA